MIKTDEQLAVNTGLSQRCLRLAAIQAKTAKSSGMALWTFPELYSLATKIADSLLYRELSEEVRRKYALGYCLQFLKTEGRCDAND